ncbi:hypothetical protein EI42_02593 [Thermosporothrix hazakensis]|jgi:uncharacterized membrane protein|uniref:Uncharacterized protein n=1 Tax=Thermosporothrix hazakensis TaxID=644383 RepID=A0A326U893_THEHA|nr:hypothetical protein [Thermosporothrix hazakensis]PZW30619.1 hypothetical protein EI42_02593 [Thermosporothrix hazakensis]GCE49482.1 hypothetical protein KTH_43510 [Thermosporothrix hazakensis]
MEQLNTDQVTATPSRFSERKRFDWLYFLPILGIIWVLFLTVAVVFQLPIGGVVDPVMTFMIVIFFLFVGVMYWAFYPKSNR